MRSPMCSVGAVMATVEESVRPVVALREVEKAFGTVRALRGAGLELHAGEAHALVGENGAGKSTLIKILAGLYRPDAGWIEMDGEPVVLHDPAASIAAGIAVIYQEPALFGDLSVAENLFIGRQPRGRFNRIDRAAMNRQAADLFERLGVPLEPDRPAKGLSIADQQLVEIAKAISLDARVLVMDEPTAALTAREVERLFEVVNALRAKGTAILFISHRFDEVEALCQRVTVMRDGAHVSTDHIEDVTVDELIRRMVGRELAAMFPRGTAEPGEVVLDVEGLTREGRCRDVTFQVRAGEIVALAGLVGRRPQRGRPGRLRDRAPRRRARAGARPRPPLRQPAGRHEGREWPSSPRTAASRGCSSTSRSRATPPWRDATACPASDSSPAAPNGARPPNGPGGFRPSTGASPTRSPPSRAATSRRSSSPNGSPPGPRLLIVDEPTRGIDVATKAEVHRLLADLAVRRRGRPHGLLRTPRSARHGRPRPGHARRPPRRRTPARRTTEEAVMRLATGRHAEAPVTALAQSRNPTGSTVARPGPALPRARAAARARRPRRGDQRRQRPLPVRAVDPRPALRRGGDGAARLRYDSGGPHPRHRPLRGLDPRPRPPT